MEILTNSIVGIIVGLLVCLILILILHNTAFKGKVMMILYLIMFVLFGLGGGAIQKNYFTLSADAIPSPQEQIQNINTTVSENWKNTNGGFTFEEIKKAQEDSECPIYDDQVIDLKCYDFGSYIVFLNLKELRSLSYQNPQPCQP